MANKIYRVKPYMVMNKVFAVGQGKVDFPIVAFSELEKMLKEL